jgi:hypothetical protein
MAAYQEWGMRHLEMVGGETKHFFDDAQKFMQSSAHLVLNGWQSKGIGISS